MKKRNYVLKIFLLLLIIEAVYLFLRFYPVWKAAEYVQKNMDLAHFSYEVEVELAQDRLQENQRKLIEVLTELTGFEKADLCRLSLKGNVWEDKIHVLIYPGGAGSPLAELYLGDDTAVINETMLYNTIRNYLTEKVGILGLVLPEQKETLYITLEQVEQLFGLDLKDLRQFRLWTEGDKSVTSHCFLMMAAMSREKAENWTRFTMETEQLALQLQVPEAENTGGLELKLDVEDPVGFVEKEAQILSLLQVPVAGEKLESVLRFSVTIVPGGEPVSMPVDFVNQTVVELITRIREWVMKFGQGSTAGQAGNF